MKSNNLNLAFSVLIMAFSSIANAGLINFYDLDKGEYSGNSDFTVTGTVADSDELYTPMIGTAGEDNDINNPRVRWLCNSKAISPYNCYDNEEGNIINFAFSEGMDSIFLSLYWAGNVDSSGGDASISSYDINGVMLETFGRTTSTATYSFNSATDIYAIRTDLGFPNDNSDRGWWYGIASIDYTKSDVTDVPEPSTLAIFALGMIGLASRRFNKQS